MEVLEVSGRDALLCAQVVGILTEAEETVANEQRGGAIRWSPVALTLFLE